jgi:hypothetical protein
MIIAQNIEGVLLVTGIVTALPILLFLFPSAGLKHLFKLGIDDPAGRFFARHWGLMAFSVGLLLVFAAHHPELRRPVMLVALIEKAGLVALIIAHWNQPHTRGLRGVVAFDGACVIVYALFLLGIA